MRFLWIAAIAACRLIPAGGARAQADLGIAAGPDALFSESRSSETAGSAVSPLALAMSLAFDTTTWTTLKLSTSSTPAVELSQLLRRGYYRLELCQMLLLAKSKALPLRGLILDREKGVRMREIAAKAGADFDAVYEESLALERKVGTRLMPSILTVSSAGALDAPAPERGMGDGREKSSLPASPARRLPAAALSFPDGRRITVELALTPRDREQGLMNRRSLPEDYGMLFAFPREQFLEFWMKNTWVDLDMIFIRSDKRIAEVHRNVARSAADTPEGALERRGGLAQYVLELPAGAADRRRLRKGQALVFDVPLPAE